MRIRITRPEGRWEQVFEVPIQSDFDSNEAISAWAVERCRSFKRVRVEGRILEPTHGKGSEKEQFEALRSKRFERQLRESGRDLMELLWTWK